MAVVTLKIGLVTGLGEVVHRLVQWMYVLKMRNGEMGDWEVMGENRGDRKSVV